MLIEVRKVAAGSHRAKFQPAIEKTIDDLKRAKVKEIFERLIKDVEIPCVIGTTGTEWEAAKNLIDAFLNPWEPIFEHTDLYLKGAAKGFGDLIQFLPADRRADWATLTSTLKSALYERGCRGNMNLWTPFERTLLNDVVSGYVFIKNDGKIDYRLEHVPISINQNEFNLTETALGREYAVVGRADARYFHVIDAPSRRVYFSLSTLGEDGKALWMPMAIEKEKLADALNRLPIEQAFLECKLEGATLDEPMVRKYMVERLKITSSE